MDKKFFANTFYNIIYRVSNVFFPFVTSIYVSYVLHADGVGRIASVQNIINYFVLIAALGIPNYGIREIAKSKKKRNETFWELFILNGISTTICVFVYYVMVNCCSFFVENNVLYNVMGVSLILNYINIDWYYYGCEKYRYITIRSIFMKVMSLLMLIVFVKQESDIYIYALILCLATGGNNLCNIINVFKNGVYFGYKTICLKKHLKSIVVLLGTTISIELYTLLDITMLTAMVEEALVGCYSVASKLVKVIIILLVSIGGALLPRLSSLYGKGNIEECERLLNKVFEILFVLAIPCGIGVLFLADSMVPLLYGKTFVDAILTVKILSLLLYVLTFSNLFGTQVLITVSKEKYLFKATLLGTFTNIILNSLLIPVFMQNGAAIASVVSEFVVTLMTYIYANRFFSVRLPGKTICSTLFSTGILGLFLLISKQFVNNAVMYCVWAVIGGLTIYAVCMYMCGNSIVLDVVSYISQRIKDVKKNKKSY